ncbi:DUF3576 domain-containing protein [Asticcacaulis sp. DW145]|jgi:hypothetical protein|uniref:DUF3576 domain-containing protein n=1 Tax=Asticcacaulis currens TaxID=2984210 RepID=A0ABT5I9X0_9CAUL|nr:DUF3576 domain-containing protein [Asticcacaulis currens]MDC7692979.1 DUF3576 domain-containing protein [Asticcacaulis currens]BEV09564.1 DUF3576 domain-containing protein [Asticcacaulis sp. DW145]
MKTIKKAALITLAAALSLSLTGCLSLGKKNETTIDAKAEKRGFLGLGGAKPISEQANATIGVNSYLWRASLDTISFMPLASADPWGGIIVTDWYANPEKPDERFKATVYILDTRLRADALNVSLYKQVNTGGQWVDASVSAQTQIDIENAILTRARQLRLSNVK